MNVIEVLKRELINFLNKCIKTQRMEENDWNQSRAENKNMINKIPKLEQILK